MGKLGDLLKNIKRAEVNPGKVGQNTANTGGNNRPGASIGAGANMPGNASNEGLIGAFLGANYSLFDAHIRDEDLAKLLRIFTEYLEKGIDDQQRKKMIMLFWRVATGPAKRIGGVFHPSEFSNDPNPCKRKMYYQKGSVPVDRTFIKFTAENRMERLVNLGTLLHLYVQENLQRAGILKDFEVPVNLPDYGIAGTTDGIVTFVGQDDLGIFYSEEDMLLEVKSINDNGFRQLRKPKPEHVKQASIYAHLLGYKRIVFLYYGKNDSDLKIYVMDVDEKYVLGFLNMAREVVLAYNSELRRTRTTDVKQHEIFGRVCSSRTTERAMACPHADFCFKNNN